MIKFLEIAYYVLYVYLYIMIVYILLSWTSIRNSKFYRILGKIVDPYLSIFRGWIVFSNIDFTPMLGLLLYQFVLSIISRAI
ncbi:MAG: YggT family protein [Candidatus Izemoplasmatales bacterium]|jgi:YggT family protein|nr:YggT family protein [Candidatus Izemoplasmatales bacterium]